MSQNRGQMPPVFCQPQVQLPVERAENARRFPPPVKTAPGAWPGSAGAVASQIRAARCRFRSVPLPRRAMYVKLPY